MSMNVRKRQDSPKDDQHHQNNQQYSNNIKVSLLRHENNDDDDKPESERTNLKGDYSNIAILFFLYMLQGIPLGLTAAIPMLLQNRGASYKQQAEFSFAFWPFNLKLFWAPIVDSLHWKKFGRRKSWLIPTQYMIGIFMLFLSQHVNGWLGNSGKVENLQALTIIFFFMNFLAATQDIAVDGWALTMLKRCNVGHASTCNSVGQTAGYFFGYVAFIALESKDFCNSYLRSEPQDEGLVTLPQFLWFWGICFLITTTLVGILKSESSENDNSKSEHDQRYNDHLELNIKETYGILLKIIKLRPVQILAGILLTVKVTFAACDTVTSLKLIDAGVPKDKLALLAVPIIPLQIILPLIISKYTSGPNPMDVYLKAIPYRICFSLFAVFLVYYTPYLISADGQVPVYYYIILILNYSLYQIFLYCMFVAIMAFFAKISDPAVGGTYMTLLNTVTNMGTNWPNTVVLWLVDVFTWRECVHPELSKSNTCSNKIEKEECLSSGGKCNTSIDGFYVEAAFCLIYGVVWLYLCKNKIQKLQNLPTKMWHVVNKHNIKTGGHKRS